ncbi:camk family protein kinase [Drechslerella dactyloides]|uniref:Camk family protein kinase n=1 Tax=Drechslerella dactyloides TaxID=74499 RepID=A0AAD6IST5_DREDA|nr:camk family protein kinase [Drechslerella dactyloides]
MPPPQPPSQDSPSLTIENLVFATLTPANILAKLAFSDKYDTLTTSHQTGSADGALNRMSLTKPQQKYDSSVLQFKLKLERRTSQSNSSDMSLTEPDTGDDEELRESGMI